MRFFNDALCTWTLPFCLSCASFLMNAAPLAVSDADANETHSTDRFSSTDDVRSLDTSIQTVWRIKLIGVVALAVLAALFYDLSHWFSPEAPLPFGVLSGGVALVGGGLCWLWPQWKYAAWGMALRAEELYLEHGVLNHIRTVVPLRRIQHLDVSQDLLEREFALGRLVVHTAGSRSSDVVIPGLPLETAESIRDEVKRFILEDPLMEDPV